MDTVKLDELYVAQTYKRYPVEFVEGKGSRLTDVNGKEYIDLGSGIAVNIFGAGDDLWMKAVTEQLRKLQHTSNLYYTSPQARLAEELIRLSGMKRVFFGNSGAEANECAIKAARKYASDKYGAGARPVIITLEGSFHGRTVTTLSATGQAHFHTDFAPFTPGFVHVPPNDMAAMQLAAKENSVCAIMHEIVQGEGGVNVLDVPYVKQIEALCRDLDILLIVDEVQTGNGRTGAPYAYQLFGVTPDIVSTAKGLGGGLPIGACLLGEKVQDTLTAGSHGSTFGGNPICAAGALSIAQRIDDRLLHGVAERHDLIISALSGLPGVISITGLGLILGIQTSRTATDVVAECLKKGVLVLTAKDKVRLLPALNIPLDDLKLALDVLKEVLT